jgi:hypothetical protein
MKQTSEIEEIKAALKQAAYRATHGTRGERSGRFLPAKKSANGSSRRATKQSRAVSRNR